MEGEENRKTSGDDDDVDYHAAARPHPYYGCTFCRRGFSNAQALGGHMNIHRKDRAKAQPPQPPPPAPAASSSMEGHGCHAAGSGAAGNYVAPSAERTTADHRLFGEDLGLGLSSSGGGVAVAPGGEARRQEVEEEGEVDLELRLGHQPADKSHAV